MRYTEIRMEKITDQILADIEKETVTYSPNYDGTEDILMFCQQEYQICL